MPRSRVVFLLSIYILFSSYPVRGQRSYVYEIEITSGNGKTTQTGFRLNGTTGIITALHGLVASDNIDAFNKDGKIFQHLEISKIDRERDLALLTSDKLIAEADEGFPKYGIDPISGDQVSVWGYPKSIEFTELDRVFLGNPVRRKLSGLLEPVKLQAFEERKSPDPRISVYYLNSLLTEGLSGAPVIIRGQVIGVVNGGLSDFVISWIIPINDINWQDPSTTFLKQLRQPDALSLFNYYNTEKVSLKFQHFIPGFHKFGSSAQIRRRTVTAASLYVSSLTFFTLGYLSNREFNNSYDEALALNLSMTSAGDDFARYDDLITSQDKQKFRRNLYYGVGSGLLLSNVIINLFQLKTAKKSSRHLLGWNSKTSVQPYFSPHVAKLSVFFDLSE